jgi:diguanylate cyclase (GGDEF)-like protein
MKSLMLRTTPSGVIQKLFFNTLNEKTKVPLSIFGMFDDDVADKVMQLILEVNKENTFHFSQINESNHFIAIYPFNTQIFVFVVKTDQKMDYQEIARQWIMLAIDLTKNQLSIDETEPRYFYEEIQSLNNELVNKTRIIEKMNQALNQANQKLSRRLIYDPLTDVISRYQYYEEIQATLDKNPNTCAFFCFIDIDDFKLINDRHGHHVGDAFLVEFAKRLKQVSFENKIVMRISGDEFGIFVYDVQQIGESDLMQIRKTIDDVFIEPFVVEHLNMKVSFSLGVSQYPSDTRSIDELIKYSDYAMYQAKNSQKNSSHLYSKM